MSTDPLQKLRVALGVSGGVDSALSAHLLTEAGYDVTCIYLECWRAPGCRTEEDRKDALAVALQLNKPFQVLDFKEAYRQTVVEYFFDAYQKGLTPNPDVMCNKEIKFGLFYDWAMKEGFDYVSTGHYAQVLPAANGQPALITSKDEHKDQTYFLYRLQQEQLSHILFPVGHLTKPEVRAEALRRNIPVATKKDSVGICFIGDIDVHQFLKDRLGEKQGSVVDTKGNVIGEHQGIWFYTVGQRHGFTIFPKSVVVLEDGSTVDKHNIPPFYVIGKNAERNELVVGFGREAYRSQCIVSDLNLINQSASLEDLSRKEKLYVRIRHTGKLFACSYLASDHSVQLIEEIQGLADGQSAVFYTPQSSSSSDTKTFQCLGGGVIT